MTIKSIIESGQEKLKAVADEATAKALSDEQAKQAEIDRQLAELEAVIKTIVPDELLEFCGLCSPLPIWDSRHTAIYRIDAPDCVGVSFKIGQENIPEDGHWVYHFTGLEKWPPEDSSQDRDRYNFEVEVYGVSGDKGIGYMVSPKMHYHYDDLDVALASAHEQWLGLPALNAKAEAKNLELTEKHEQAAEQVAKEIFAEEEARRKYDELISDPVLFSLVNLIGSIVHERDDYTQHLADMAEAMEENEGYHSAAVTRLERRVNEEVNRRRNAENDILTARREAEDAEAKLRAAKKTGKWAG